MMINGYKNPEFDISERFDRVLLEYHLNCRLSPSTIRELADELKFTKKDEYYHDLLFLLKQKDEEECICALSFCVHYEKVLKNRLSDLMHEFEVEMLLKCKMNPTEIEELRLLDRYWAHFYHIFSYNDYKMYSRIAHSISIDVQQLELISLCKERLRLELREAQCFLIHRRRQRFFDVIFQKQRLVLEDVKFKKKIQKEVPGLPLPRIVERQKMEKVIKKIFDIYSDIEDSDIEEED